MSVSPFRIESERLVARCWRESDAPAFRALLDRNNEHLRPFIPWMSAQPQSLEQTRARLATDEQRFIDGIDFRYALLDGEANLIGELILSTRNGENSREVGYLLDQSVTGRGYAFEACCLLVRAAFEYCNAEAVELHCSPKNLASVRIAEKSGFRLREVRENHSVDSEGRPDDSMIWTMSPTGFADSPAAVMMIRAFDRHGSLLPAQSPHS